MRDRISQYPNRIGLTDENGVKKYYTLSREDNPTQEGTKLNKANILPDDTADIYSLTEDATINDVFKSIFNVGDVKISKRTDLSTYWLLCNGDVKNNADYPSLAEILPKTKPFDTYDTFNTIFTELSNPVIDYVGMCQDKYLIVAHANVAKYFYFAYTDDLNNEWTISKKYSNYFAGSQSNIGVATDENGKVYVCYISVFMSYYRAYVATYNLTSANPISEYSSNYSSANFSAMTQTGVHGAEVRNGIVVFTQENSTSSNLATTYIHIYTISTGLFQYVGISGRSSPIYKRNLTSDENFFYIAVLSASSPYNLQIYRASVTDFTLWSVWKTISNATSSPNSSNGIIARDGKFYVMLDSTGLFVLDANGNQLASYPSMVCGQFRDVYEDENYIILVSSSTGTIVYEKSTSTKTVQSLVLGGMFVTDDFYYGYSTDGKPKVSYISKFKLPIITVDGAYAYIRAK